MNVVVAQEVDPKTAAETAKAIAEAKKAEAEAEAAAEKAEFGTLGSYETSGATEAQAGAGKLEAMLLASESTRKSAAVIAQRLCAKLACTNSGATKPNSPSPARAIFIIGESEKLSYEAYDSFRVQTLLIQRQFEAALKAEPGAGGAPQEISAATSGVAIATALGVVANLFRSDYKVSGVELTADDMVLAKSVMAAALEDGFPFPLYVPGIYSMPMTPATNPAIATLKELDELRAKASAARDQTQALVDDLNARAKQNAQQAAKLRKQAAQYAQPIADLEAAMKRYDDFLAKISAADDKGSIPLTAIARQAYIADHLANGSYLLVLKANYVGGSAYTKKNFWTFFGSMPYSVAGGALSSFTLLNGKTGAIMDAGVYAHTAPFAKVHKTVDRYVNGSPGAGAHGSPDAAAQGSAAAGAQ